METKFTFGQARSLERGAAESRIIPFILSTPTRDRHGTVLNQAAWNLDNYRKNPIVGYQHEVTGGIVSPSSPDFVIGKGIRTTVEKIAGVQCLTDALQFEDGKNNPLAEKVFRKVLLGFLNSCSVGFLPIGTGHYGEGEEGRGRSLETYYFSGQELLEWSVVHIGSNPDAGKRQSRSMRSADQEALNYASHKLRMSRSELEKYSTSDVMTLLEGVDRGIRTKDPQRVVEELREMFPEDKPLTAQQSYETKKRMKSFLISRNMKNQISLLESIKNLAQSGSSFSRGESYEKAYGQLVESGIKDFLPGPKSLLIPVASRDTIDSYMVGQEPLFPGISIENELALVHAGAKFLTGLKADATVPNLSGIVADFSDVFDSSTEAVALSEISMTAKRISTYAVVSHALFKFGGPQAESYIQNALKEAISSGLERAILSSYARSDFRPQGMGYSVTTGADTAAAAAAPTMAALATMEDAVYANGLKPGIYSYITNTLGMRSLITMGEGDFNEASIAFTGRGQHGMEFPNRMIAGYLSGHPLFLTNNAAVNLGTGADGNGLYFGNWSRLLITQFGPFAITVDTKTAAKYAQVIIYIHAWFDCKGLDGTSSTGTGTQLNDFNNFGVLPIT